MKVLVATPLYPPEPGGPATYARTLETELPGRGVSVAVYPFSSVRALPKVFRHIAYAWGVFRRGRSADVILALDPVSVGVPAALAARLLRKPLVVKVVGDYAWEQGVQRFGVTDLLDVFVTKQSYGLPVRVLKWFERSVARQAQRVIVPSEYLKRIVVAWGVSRDRIVVVPNAGPVLASPNKNALRGVLKYHGPLVITIGRLVPWKGVEGLVRAFSAEPRLADVRLVVIGDGPELPRLEALVEELGAGLQVTFTGALTHDVTMRYLKAADLFALNTAYEGFSHLLLEALTLGTPVVTTAVGGNPELIDDGVSGILVPYDDRKALASAIARVLENTPLRTRLSQGGKRAAARYTRESMVAKTAKVLKDICAS